MSDAFKSFRALFDKVGEPTAEEIRALEPPLLEIANWNPYDNGRCCRCKRTPTEPHADDCQWVALRLMFGIEQQH